MLHICQSRCVSNCIYLSSSHLVTHNITSCITMGTAAQQLPLCGIGGAPFVIIVSGSGICNIIRLDCIEISTWQLYQHWKTRPPHFLNTKWHITIDRYCVPHEYLNVSV